MGADESLTWWGARIHAVTDWPCLDLVNTVEWRLSDRNEFLASYGDLVRWANREGLLDGEEARRLLAEATRRPFAASAAHERAIALREATYAVCSAAARGAEPPAADLDALNAALAAAAVPARLVPAAGGFRREWLDPRDDLGWLLGPVARSAADLLVSPELARLKECPGGPGKACGYLFLDETKNRSRRWCSGRTCGNRTRLHRHYARVRIAGVASGAGDPPRVEGSK